MMSSLIFAIVTFFLHALVLKIAAGAMGAPRAKNTYPRALKVAFGLSVAGFLLGFIPIVSLPLYGILWIAVIMSVYDLGFMRSIGVAFVQVGLKLLLALLLKLFGFSVTFGQMMSAGF
ncbi:MAG: hypothetical protein ACLFVJ_19670 [Persicimonas sp.]